MTHHSHVTLSEATSEVAKSKGPHRYRGALLAKDHFVSSGDPSTHSRTRSLRVTWAEGAVIPSVDAAPGWGGAQNDRFFSSPRPCLSRCRSAQDDRYSVVFDGWHLSIKGGTYQSAKQPRSRSATRSLVRRDAPVEGWFLRALGVDPFVVAICFHRRPGNRCSLWRRFRPSTRCSCRSLR